MQFENRQHKFLHIRVCNTQLAGFLKVKYQHNGALISLHFSHKIIQVHNF